MKYYLINNHVSYPSEIKFALQVEGMGCSCVGRVCVEPEILPANLASRSAGVTLLDKINRLTAKVLKIF